MRRIYSARNSVEAQAIIYFLDSKGIQAESLQNVSGLQFGIFDIPIFVPEGQFTENLEPEIRNFLRETSNNISIDQQATQATETPPPVWSPLQALGVYLFMALPGGFALANLLLLRQYSHRLGWFIGVLCIISYFILVKKTSIAKYLNFEKVPILVCAACVLVEVTYYFVSRWIILTFHFPSTDFFREALKHSPVTTLIGAVILAPIVEEAVYRGFLFKSFERSNPWLGIFLLSLLWAVSHYPYNVYQMSEIFIAGILFGYTRMKTKSIIPTICMHAIFNLFVSIQTILYIRSH